MTTRLRNLTIALVVAIVTNVTIIVIVDNKIVPLPQILITEKIDGIIALSIIFSVPILLVWIAFEIPKSIKIMKFMAMEDCSRKGADRQAEVRALIKRAKKVSKSNKKEERRNRKEAKREERDLAEHNRIIELAKQKD